MIKITLNEIKKRKLKNCYVAIYLLTHTIPLRHDNIVELSPICIIYGVDIGGQRTIIDIVLENRQDNRFWLELFEDIKARGVLKIFFLIVNDDKNIDRAIKLLYNDTIIVSSAMNIIDKFSKYLSTKRSSDTGQILKTLFLSDDFNKYKIELELIREKFKDYAIINVLLDKNLSKIESYYKFCKDIRKLIFPYFSIRDMQCKFRKYSNLVESFGDVDDVIISMLDYFNSFENGRSYSKVEWLNLMNILHEMHGIEIERYI